VNLHRPYCPQDEQVHIRLTPEDAGWTWTGLQVLAITAGTPLSVRTGPSEAFVLPLTGSVSVHVARESGESIDAFFLRGRESVFTGVTDFCYVGRDSVITLSAVAGAEVALPSARCSTVLPPAYAAAELVPVEVRGAGNATRQINHILKPEFHAHRLLVVEVFTPAGSWSSFPPHKHDVEAPPGEVVLEEVYAYRVSRPEGFGVQRVYTRDGELDEVYAVHDGDAVLVPRGYHPFAAAHGYDCYYLNALAGDIRSMAASDDPDLAWVRGSWAELGTDPRVPLVGGSR
jgi:5-deoxy-glucuronate isomerase